MSQYFAEEKYPLQEETYLITGIAMEVHRVLGKGFSETVYKYALEFEFKQQKILFEREKRYEVSYKGIVLPHKYFADFVVFDKIILEIKCSSGIIEKHHSQLINYPAISKLKVGLILNFSNKSLEHRRIIF